MNPLHADPGPLPIGRRSALMMLVGLLGGCLEPPVPPARLGINAWVGYDPLVLARDRGLLDGGLIKVVELATGAETQRHLRNNLLDAGALTLDEVLRMRDRGLDLRVIALLDTSRGGDVVMAAPRIRKPADLLGQAIAVEDSSVGTLMFHRLLEAAGLAATDVRQTNLEATLHLQALRSGQVAAAVSYQPLAGAMASAGFHPLFDSRQIPGQVLDVLAVRKSLLDNRPDAADAMLLAWHRGLALLALDPHGAAESLSVGTDLSAADYRLVMGGLQFFAPDESLAALSDLDGPVLRAGREVGDLMVRLGMLGAPPEWDRLIDTGPARRLLAARTR